MAKRAPKRKTSQSVGDDSGTPLAQQHLQDLVGLTSDDLADVQSAIEHAQASVRILEAMDECGDECQEMLVDARDSLESLTKFRDRFFKRQ